MAEAAHLKQKFSPLGRIVAVSVSASKGEKKINVSQGVLVANLGLDGDAHAGNWHRQISLLAQESIDKMKAKGLEVVPGDFAENITTSGFAVEALPVGTCLRLGAEALIEITQIGKVCHNRCAIFHQVGDCVMPREGVFARILKGGRVRPGDVVEIAEQTVGRDTQRATQHGVRIEP
jgi:MOSC domain-containing protein YiiM